MADSVEDVTGKPRVRYAYAAGDGSHVRVTG
jgi:hypothetical protein